MLTAFRALCWKELRVVRVLGAFVLGLSAILFLASLAFAGPVGNNPNPALRFTWFGFLLAAAGAVIGFVQAHAEAQPGMWIYATHRGASGVQLYGAKALVGLGTLLVATGVPYALAMWWLATPGHVPIPFDRSYWLGGIGAYLAAFNWYAAGSYAALGPEQYASRTVGVALALAGSAFAFLAPTFALAAGVNLAISAGLFAAATGDYLMPLSFTFRPFSGRYVRSAGGTFAFALAASLAIGLMRFTSPQPAAARREGPAPLATVTQDGRLVLVNDGKVTGLDGARPVRQRHRESRGGHGVIISERCLSTRPRRRRRGCGRITILPAASRGSIPGRGDGTVWYYDEREGLISVYEASGNQRGWLGPDGFSEGTARPANRFSGKLRQEVTVPRRDALELSGGVYLLNELSPPLLLFKAPKGEMVLRSSPGRLFGGMMPRRNAAWSWYRIVTTTGKTYVIDQAKRSLEIGVAHPRVEAGTRVVVFRAPNAAPPATYIWYVHRQRRAATWTTRCSSSGGGA